MAKIIKRREPPTSGRCTCGHCTSVIEYKVSELRWISDHPPYFGLNCPACGKRIFKTGRRN